MDLSSSPFISEWFITSLRSHQNCCFCCLCCILLSKAFGPQRHQGGKPPMAAIFIRLLASHQNSELDKRVEAGQIVSSFYCQLHWAWRDIHTHNDQIVWFLWWRKVAANPTALQMILNTLSQWITFRREWTRFGTTLKISTWTINPFHAY